MSDLSHVAFVFCWCPGNASCVASEEKRVILTDPEGNRGCLEDGRNCSPEVSGAVRGDKVTALRTESSPTCPLSARAQASILMYRLAPSSLLSKLKTEL